MSVRVNEDLLQTKRCFCRPALLAWVMLVVNTVIAASSSLCVYAADASVDTEKALRSLHGNNWYDADAQNYKPPTVSPPLDDTIRRSGWETKKSNWAWDWDWDWWGTGGGGGGNWGISADAVGWAILIILGTLLVGGLIAVLYFYLGDSLPFRKKTPRVATQLQFDIAKVEELPFEVQHNSGNPLADAEALMRTGRYNEAVVYLYGYMLLTLDHARKIHLQKGKTNRMYLRELRGQTSLAQIVNRTMLAFEDVFFGRYNIDAARFTQLWGQLEEFHRLVQPVAPATASPADRKVATT